MYNSTGHYTLRLETVWEGDWGARVTVSAVSRPHPVIEIRAVRVPNV